MGTASCCFTPDRDHLIGDGLADELADHELIALAFLAVGAPA